MKKFALVFATLAMSLISMSAVAAAAPDSSSSSRSGAPKPNTNSVSYWCPAGGVKFDNLSKKTFTVPAPPSGFTWTKAIVKAGSVDTGYGPGNDAPISPVVVGQVLSHSTGKNISHVIICYTKGNQYPMHKPSVWASSSNVHQGKSFTVSAKGFCPNTPLKITLSNNGKTYTKWTPTNSSGMATVTFNSGNIKPGTYKITASQNTSKCKKTATSTVKILSKGGYGFAGDDFDSSAGAGFAAMNADMAANAQAAANAANLRASSQGLADNSGSSSPSGVPSSEQLLLAALLCVGGLGAVATIRRRSLRLATLS